MTLTFAGGLPKYNDNERTLKRGEPECKRSAIERERVGERLKCERETLFGKTNCSFQN